MPIYTYRCHHCKEVFDVRHGMFFVQERCEKCHTTGFLEKIPNVPQKLKTGEEKKKTGSEVVKFIEQTKKDVAEEKRRLREKEL